MSHLEARIQGIEERLNQINIQDIKQRLNQINSLLQSPVPSRGRQSRGKSSGQIHPNVKIILHALSTDFQHIIAEVQHVKEEVQYVKEEARRRPTIAHGQDHNARADEQGTSPED